MLTVLLAALGTPFRLERTAQTVPRMLDEPPCWARQVLTVLLSGGGAPIC